MPQIIALDCHKTGDSVYIWNNRGISSKSKNVDRTLELIIEPYDDAIYVTWDMQSFLKPIFEKLPKDVVEKLNNGERAIYKNFRLFYGVGKGAVFGVTYKQRTLKPGTHNIYDEKVYETNVYELKIYFPNDKPANVVEVRDLGKYLLDILKNMHITPTKLTSPAAIYEEAVLRRMELPNIFNMPENALEMAEWCANYCREWRSAYKIGNFEKTMDADITGAYPSVLAKVPNLLYADYIKTNGEIPKDAFWGILKGQLTITGDISPIVSPDGICYKGTREDYITTDELANMKKWGYGYFTPTAGWFFKLKKHYYPFSYIMEELFSYRGKNDVQDRLAKGMANTVWAKFIERHGEKFGDYYYPPIAAMVTSKIRCIVNDFIYENQLQKDLIAVNVDGVLTTKRVDKINSVRMFGQWRLTSSSPALVLSPTYQWTADKKPNGFTYQQMLDEIKAHPLSKHWNGVSLRFLENVRQFNDMPKSGRDLLNNKVFDSEALEI